MPTYRYATKELSIASAKSFLDKIRAVDIETKKNSSILYAVLGKSSPWDDEPTPNEITDTVQNNHFDLHRNFIGGKKINESGVSHVATRTDWQSGTVYSMYKESHTDLYNMNFFVVTDEMNVYKCLYNNKGEASTERPSGYATAAVTLSDGYVWRYMYTISLGSSEKFMTTSHIPVDTIITSDNTPEQTRQQAVQNAAVNGSIEIVETGSPGANYHQFNQAVVEFADATTLRFSSSGEQTGIFGAISTNDDFYSGSSVYIKSGTGAGQLRRVTDYVGSTKTLTVNTAFQTIPGVGATALISPTVTIIGDGSGCQAYVKVHEGSGGVANVAVINQGEGYTRAQARISDGQGSGATANVIISPLGGHGKDAIRELGGDRLMLNVTFKGSEGISSTGAGYIPANTDFRTISILKDPILKVNSNNVRTDEAVANTSNSPESLRFTHRASISYISISDGLPTDPLLSGDTITNERMRASAANGTLEFVTELTPAVRELNGLANALQGANAEVVYIRDDETKNDPSFYTMYLNNLHSYSDHVAFTKDDTIIKSTDQTKIAVIKDMDAPEANTYSGEVLYSENISKVTKNNSQLEDIKIILDF